MILFYGLIFIALLFGIITILVMLTKGDDVDEDVFSSTNDNDYMKKL